MAKNRRGLMLSALNTTWQHEDPAWDEILGLYFIRIPCKTRGTYRRGFLGIFKANPESKHSIYQCINISLPKDLLETLHTSLDKYADGGGYAGIQAVEYLKALYPEMEIFKISQKICGVVVKQTIEATFGTLASEIYVENKKMRPVNCKRDNKLRWRYLIHEVFSGVFP